MSFKWLMIMISSVAASVSGAQTLQNRTPAVVEISKMFEADKTSTGERLETKLIETVKLGSGTVLPKGTILEAKIVDSSMGEGNTRRLTLRFTDAKLKNGNVVRIAATIIDFATVARPVTGSSLVEITLSPRIDLTHRTDITSLRPTDEKLSLQSDAKDENSGTFTSINGKLSFPWEAKLALAIEPLSDGS